MSAIRYSFGGDEHVFAEIDEEIRDLFAALALS